MRELLAAVKWFLTWFVSPAPLSLLLVGVAFALGVWGVFANRALTRFDRTYALLTSGRCVWIAPPSDSTPAARDTT
jgi:hypothetical protein